jgi:flagellar motor switch protein FliN/FliY
MNEAVGKFCQLWPEELASLLGQMGVAGAAATGDAPKPKENATQELLTSGVHARFVGGGALKGELVIACESAVALSLAQAFMSEPLDASIEFGSSHKDAYLELVRQVAGVVATDWKSEVGRDALISFHSAAEPPFVGTTEVTIEVHGESLPSVALKLALNKEMADILNAQQEAPAAAAAPTTAPAELAPAKQFTADSELRPAAGAIPPVNLDLLLDVDLEATIRFGEREMLLKEIYGLMPGTVIELDQLINEPAQLLVAGRTVAWGEVVVVDGNFGLRVTEVASKGQRAEMLRL